MGKHDSLIKSLTGWITNNKDDVAALKSGNSETFDYSPDGRSRVNTTKETIEAKEAKIRENEALKKKCEDDNDE